MRKLIVLLAFFLLFAGLSWAADSDNDSVSDDQESIDGTDPGDPNSNLLELRIEGDRIVGSSIELSLVHPALGRIKNVEFSFFYGNNKQSPNSGSTGAVQFIIVNAGRHLVRVKTGAFSREFEFYPACAVAIPVIAEFSWLVDFMGFFVAFVIGALSFAGFRKLLNATDSDYFWRKHPLFVTGYFGLALFVISVYFYQLLGRLTGLIVLLVLLVVLLVVLWLLRSRGLLKPVPDKPLSRKAKRALKGVGFPALIVASLVELFVAKKKVPVTKVDEMLALREDITDSIGRVNQAKAASFEAKSRSEKQVALKELSREVGAFNSFLMRFGGLKKSGPVAVAITKDKSLEDLRKEKRSKLMVEDLIDQMAKEVNVRELPDEPEGVKEPVEKKKGSVFGVLKSIFIGDSKYPIDKVNLDLRLFDSFGNPLPAIKAEFFVSGKKTRPLFSKDNLAAFQLMRGDLQVFVRMLGFIDSIAEVSVSKEKTASEVKLSADFVLNLTDGEGKPLNDAFVNILGNNNMKIEDTFGNAIWKSPFPSNAPAGTIAVPIDPTNLHFDSFKAKVVRAGYVLKEVIVPANRISTQKALEKKVSLEMLAKQ